MAKLMIVALCCLLLAGFCPTAMPLQLKTTSTVIDATTAPFVVNCTYFNHTIANLVSLAIYKDGNGSSPDELAFFNFFDQAVNVIPDPFDFVPSGSIDPVGESYLSLMWDFPTAKEAGTYYCEATGLDDVGHNMEIQVNETITYVPPTLDQLMQALRREQMQRANLSEALSNLAASVKSMSSCCSMGTVANGTVQVTPANSDADGLVERVNELELFKEIVSKSYPSTNTSSSQMYKGHRYVMLRDTPSTHMDAQVACLLQGGYLAEVDDQGEFDFIRTFINSTAPEGVAFIIIGARQDARNGPWTFTETQKSVDLSFLQTNQTSSWVRPKCMFLSNAQNWMGIIGECIYTLGNSRALCEIPSQ